MKRFFWMCIPLILSAESFININEYGQMLYKNPRGVGCDKCHGEKGEGKMLARFINAKKSEVAIMGPKLKGISQYQLEIGLAKKNRFMPTYYLSRTEIEAISHYLQQGTGK